MTLFDVASFFSFRSHQIYHLRFYMSTQGFVKLEDRPRLTIAEASILMGLK